jgi:hypothetical protein
VFARDSRTAPRIEIGHASPPGEEVGLAAQLDAARRAALFRPGFDVRIEADACMRCTAREFIVETDLRAFEDGVEIEAQRFDTRVPRADA